MGNLTREAGSSSGASGTTSTSSNGTGGGGGINPSAGGGPGTSTTQRPPPPSYESLLAAVRRTPSLTGGGSVASVVGGSVGNVERRPRSGGILREQPLATIQVSQDAGVLGTAELRSPSADESSAAVAVWEALTEEEARRKKRGVWQHDSSYVFACICVVLGMYNISRFAVMVYIYKGYFVFEFIILTMILGVPFLYAMMTMGQYLGSGMLDMWYISPAFKGIGFAILYLYSIAGVYTTVPIAWLFVYFKDSFITTREHYRWALCQPRFAAESCILSLNSSAPDLVGWTVPSYFNGRVLDRRSANDSGSMGDLRFEIAFHLAIIWLLVFVCLSRGLRSLGKVVFILGTLPIVLLLLVAIRFMEQWSDSIGEIFSESGRKILLDSVSWLLAAREVFMIWGVYGAAVFHLSSHNKLNYKVTKNLLIVVGVTLTVLIVGSLLCISAMQIVTDRNLIVIPSSFEDESLIKFIQPRGLQQLSPGHNASSLNLWAGSCMVSSNMDRVSGYQVMRLAVEVMPAAFALEGARNISSFWAICFYATMILFALGQQITTWFCVVESLISLKPKVLKPWQTIITFIACNVGFLVGLPMTTNMGIYIVFFVDFCVGSLWWIVVLYLIALVAVLFIRGHPYGTDQLVNLLAPEPKTKLWLLPLLTFFWNVVLPVSFLVLAIAFLRWTPTNLDLTMEGPFSYRFWPNWVKKLAFFVQVFPLIMAASICAANAYHYLTPKSQTPLHERIQAWCCPVFVSTVIPSNSDLLSSSTSTSGHSATSANSPSNQRGVVNSAYEEDPPPKYTPPPSYSTATSKNIIKQLLRQTSYSELEAARQACASIGMPAGALPGVELVSYDPQPENSTTLTRQ